MHFALYSRNFGPSTADGMKKLTEYLSTGGAVISCYAPLHRFLCDVGTAGIGDVKVFDSAENLPADADIFLALGGDGTFLSSLTMVGAGGMPVAGINFGRLGFLASSAAEDAGCGVIDRLLAGEYEVAQRSVLEVASEVLPEDVYPFALNEISIQRSGPKMIAIDVSIDGMRIPTYWADGLLIATPTGSTAYSLSVGGPVVVPDSSVFIIAPVAPHNLNVRPLIVSDSSNIEVTIRAEGSSTFISADNRSIELKGEYALRIRKAPFTIGCVSFGKDTFFDALNEKLLWGVDRRNDRTIINK